MSSGEEATSQGEFFEALNWAGEKLPVVFLIQNNGYAISVPQQAQTGFEIHRIAQGFGIRLAQKLPQPTRLWSVGPLTKSPTTMAITLGSGSPTLTAPRC